MFQVLSRVMRKKRLKAFSLIEVLMVLSIFLIVTISFYRIFASGSNLIAESKRRLLATGLVTEKMERIRGLEYGSIGVVSGNPSGDIDPDEYVVSGGQQFHVLTYIVYVDDPDDGIQGSGDDTPNDYKRIQIDVKWKEELSSQNVTLISNIAPAGTEADIGGGTLSINIIDTNGSSISGASVNVYNDHVSPIVNQTIVSDANGSVSIPGSEPSDQNYEISVSKSGYESAGTLPPYPTTSYYPVNVHASVVEGMITNSVITIGQLSDLEIQFVDPYGDSIGNVDFDMNGGRLMGNETDGSPVYNYSDSLESDADGIITISNLSPGQYSFAITETGYVAWKSNSVLGNEPDEIILPQGQKPYVQDIILLDESVDSYFVRIIDAVTGGPIEAASVTLENTLLSYSETVSTDQYGYAFFPDDQLNVLVNGETYDVSVSATGYGDENSTVTINQLVQETISMSP
ncbi:MAG: carboxypeptidase regulatory-like domain-containing protein [Candidatus Moranbacteria bacterium]|nr:carboxypeptidase regulatory-like domain-containing protein [Candidatus Moranbacteria bacterium]